MCGMVTDESAGRWLYLRAFIAADKVEPSRPVPAHAPRAPRHPPPNLFACSLCLPAALAAVLRAQRPWPQWPDSSDVLELLSCELQVQAAPEAPGGHVEQPPPCQGADSACTGTERHTHKLILSAQRLATVRCSAPSTSQRLATARCSAPSTSQRLARVRRSAPSASPLGWDSAPLFSLEVKNGPKWVKIRLEWIVKWSDKGLFCISCQI